MLPLSAWPEQGGPQRERGRDRSTPSVPSRKRITPGSTSKDVAPKGTPRWLSITAACEMLGVDHSTMRRWSDSGKIPVVRTPGGHRRYSEQDLRAFLHAAGNGAGRVNRRELTKLSLEQYDELRRESELAWAGSCTPQWRTEMRDLGRRIVDLGVRYACERGNRGAVMAESRMLAERHGRRSAEAGLRASDLIEGLFQIRRPVLQAACQYIEGRQITLEGSCRLMSELTDFMDELTRVAIHTFEEHVPST